MNILRGILKDSKRHYQDVEKKLTKRLAKLPVGSIKKRKINNRYYYYLQRREAGKIVQEYIGKKEPKDLIQKIQEREQIKKELKKVFEALKTLKRTTGK